MAGLDRFRCIVGQSLHLMPPDQRKFIVRMYTCPYLNVSGISVHVTDGNALVDMNRDVYQLLPP